MSKQFEVYLSKKQEEACEAAQKEREQLLLQEGLFTREYYQGTGCPSTEYPEFEYDEKLGANRYYKKVPLALSDEEYRKLREVAQLRQDEEEEEKKSGGNNIVAWMLTVLTVIIVVGGVLLGILADTAMTRLFICFIAIFCGSILAALAEIIKLMENEAAFEKEKKEK